MLIKGYLQFDNPVIKPKEVNENEGAMWWSRVEVLVGGDFISFREKSVLSFIPHNSKIYIQKIATI